MNTPAQATAPTRVRVFISFTIEDLTVARALQALVVAELGLKDAVFLSKDPVHIAAGEDWRKKIDDALDSCDVLLALLSARSTNAPWVNWEAGGVARSKRLVIPVCIGNMSPPKLQGTPYSNLQGLSLPGDYTGLLERLHAVLPGSKKPREPWKRVADERERQEKLKTATGFTQVALLLEDEYDRLRSAIEHWTDEALT